jgi:integrase
MSNKVVNFPTTKIIDNDYLKNVKRYKFGLYSCKMTYVDGTWKQHWFIALKEVKTNVVLELTPYSRYLRFVRRKLGIDSRRPETLRTRGSFICLFLNYVLIDMCEEFRITNLKNITIEHGNRFLQAYADGEVTRFRKKKRTMAKMIIEVARFYTWLQAIHDKDAVHIHGIKMLEKVDGNNRDGETHCSYNTPFQVHLSPKVDDPIFRDMPDKAFWTLIKLSQIYYPEITLGLCLEAFAGLRVGEVCNVRQHICPLDGGGIVYRKTSGKLSSFKVNLKNKYPMRSDGVDVGSIKRYRNQYVYIKFLPYLVPIFEKHMTWLNHKNIDKGYYPLFVEGNGMAMTTQNYRKKFKRLVHEYLVDVLIRSDDYKMRIYGQMLMNEELSTHALRHWFTVQLVLNNESVHSIADWRGDTNDSTALIYVNNKSELRRLHKQANEAILEDINDLGLNLYR